MSMDSPGYRNILKLFEQGCIHISQFGDIRTVAQYILSTVDANIRRGRAATRASAGHFFQHWAKVVRFAHLLAGGLWC